MRRRRKSPRKRVAPDPTDGDTDMTDQTTTPTKPNKPARVGRLGKLGGSNLLTRSTTPQHEDGDDVRRSTEPQDEPDAVTNSRSKESDAGVPHKLGRLGRQSRIESTNTSPVAKPRKLGKLGGAALRTDDATDSEATASPTPRKPVQNVGHRSAESDNDVSDARQPAQTQESQPAASTSRQSQLGPSPRKLGRLGGPKAHDEASQMVNDASSTTATLPNGAQSQTSQPHQRSPTPEETAEQKANRKREELKRQLEEKAKHQVKKKRRF